MSKNKGIKKSISNSPALCAETVKDIFTYNYTTGLLSWKISRSKTVVGSLAGSVGPDRRRRVCYKRKNYLACRIIWLFHYGKWSEHNIDHIDMDCSNDRISNLRDVTHSYNAANTKARVKNNTGIKGVFRDSERQKYKATIMKNGRTYNLGRFDTLEEAKAAYDAKAFELFGESARP